MTNLKESIRMFNSSNIYEIMIALLATVVTALLISLIAIFYVPIIVFASAVVLVFVGYETIKEKFQINSN